MVSSEINFTGFAQVLKTSEGAKKAWLTRQRKAQESLLATSSKGVPYADLEKVAPNLMRDALEMVTDNEHHDASQEGRKPKTQEQIKDHLAQDIQHFQDGSLWEKYPKEAAAIDNLHEKHQQKVNDAYQAQKLRKWDFAHILKTSEGARKAWETRSRAPKILKETPLRHVSAKELVELIGAQRLNSIKTSKWYPKVSHYPEHAYKHRINSIGDHEVEIYPYGPEHRNAEGRARPDRMVRFVFVNRTVKQAHLFTRPKDDNRWVSVDSMVAEKGDGTPFGNFMSDFFHSAHNKAKYKAPKQMIAVALSIAERKGLHYIPVAQRSKKLEGVDRYFGRMPH